MTTVNYGISGTLSKSFEDGYTVADLLADKNILGVLGAPENVRAISAGETLSGDELVNDYTTITLDKQASSKA